MAAGLRVGRDETDGIGGTGKAEEGGAAAGAVPVEEVWAVPSVVMNAGHTPPDTTESSSIAQGTKGECRTRVPANVVVLPKPGRSCQTAKPVSNSLRDGYCGKDNSTNIGRVAGR